MSNTTDDDMQDDYTDVFADQQPVRGKYYERAMRSKPLVEIDADLLKAFQTRGSSMRLCAVWSKRPSM